MATTTTPLEMCHKLIALATNNPNEHEAQLAALKAVKLIKEHNLLPGAPSVSRRPVMPSPPPRPQDQPYGPSQAQTDYYDHGDDIFNYFFGGRRGRKSPFKEGSTYDRVTAEAEEISKKAAYYRSQAEEVSKQRQRDAQRKAANKGHEWDPIYYTCKRCKMGQALYNATEIGCHDYGRGERDPTTGIPHEVLRKLDEILRDNPAKGKELQDILERNRNQQNIKW